MSMHFTPKRSVLAAALVALLSGAPSAWAQTPPVDETPVVVIEDRSLRERTDERNLTLENELALVDAAGNPIVTLPVGTMIGREKLESRFTADNQLIRQRTDLRNVTLAEEVTVNNRATGETVTLPAGTVIRVKLDQRLDANGNVVRDRIDLRARLADGTRIRIRDRAPEIEVNDVEINDNDEVGSRHRQRGREGARSDDNSSSGRAARSERSGSDARSERSGRLDRPERGSGRGDRPERGGRSGKG